MIKNFTQLLVFGLALLFGSAEAANITLYYNNKIVTWPVKLTNSASITWSTNANGDLVGTAVGGGSVLTNTFNGNQFSTIGGTNISFKSGATMTNTVQTSSTFLGVSTFGSNPYGFWDGNFFFTQGNATGFQIKGPGASTLQYEATAEHVALAKSKPVTWSSGSNVDTTPDVGINRFGPGWLGLNDGGANTNTLGSLLASNLLTKGTATLTNLITGKIYNVGTGGVQMVWSNGPPIIQAPNASWYMDTNAYPGFYIMSNTVWYLQDSISTNFITDLWTVINLHSNYLNAASNLINLNQVFALSLSNNAVGLSNNAFGSLVARTNGIANLLSATNSTLFTSKVIDLSYSATNSISSNLSVMLIDASLGNSFAARLTEGVMILVTNFPPTNVLWTGTLDLQMDGTGGYPVRTRSTNLWTTNGVLTAGTIAITPFLNSTANGVSFLNFASSRWTNSQGKVFNSAF